MLRPLPKWLKYLLIWTAAGVFYITQDFITRLSRNESIPWLNTVLAWMTAMYICALFTPPILWLGRRWPVAEPHRLGHIAIHLGASVVFSVLSTALEVLVIARLGILPWLTERTPFLAGFWMLLPYDLHGGVLRYWAVIGVQALDRSNRAARQNEREALELKIQLASSQLSALKSQMQPHFLFNTLSAIMVLVRQGNAPKAEDMLSRLSDLLRHTLDDVETQEVPLWRELNFLRLYLSIEQVRFEDRLRVRIDAGPEVSNALVPHMALQPIVENAVRHGLGESEEPVLIHVTASRVEGSLALTVTDDGPGCPPSAFDKPGIGLANTRNRLDRLYGGNAAFSAENRLPRGVRVTMTIPWREDLECS